MRAKALLLVVSGCSVNLEPWEATPEADGDRDLPRPAACRPFTEVATNLAGRMDSVELADGRVLVTAEAATIAKGTGPHAFVLSERSPCPRRADEILPANLELALLGLEGTATPMASVTADATYTYFAWHEVAGNVPAGFGVARWDLEARRLVPLAILWTSDRPNYGSGAVLHDGFSYVFGARPARFLSADVYVARVAVDAIGEPGAYEYWYGGGNWGPLVDEGVALIEGGTQPSVAWDNSHGRWLMSYVAPFAQTITLRSGLGLVGPWSRPVAAASCDVDSNDPMAYCANAILHSALAPAGLVAWTYSAEDAALGESADTLLRWPRAAQISWPRLP